MFRNLGNEIRAIYVEDERVASNDKLLISKVWLRHGWDNSKDLYENLLAMPSIESITRCRRKLVEAGYLKPSEKATEARYKAFKDYREEYYYL